MKYIDFRVKLLSHGQILEISDALITKPVIDQSTQNRHIWHLLPRHFQDQFWINAPIPILNLQMQTNRKTIWRMASPRMASPMEQLVLSFRPVAGAFKWDVESQFFHAYFWPPQQWETLKKLKKKSKAGYFLQVQCTRIICTKEGIS